MSYPTIVFDCLTDFSRLMHCHIGWHTSEGFALQLVERLDEIPALVDNGTMKEVCDAWATYSETTLYVQDDSGV